MSCNTLHSHTPILTPPGRSAQQVRELGLPKILDVIYVGCPASGKAEGVLELRMALYDIAFSLTLPRCKCSLLVPTLSLVFLAYLPPPPPPPPPHILLFLLFPLSLLLSFLSSSWCCQSDQATGAANSCLFPEAGGESEGACKGLSS